MTKSKLVEIIYTSNINDLTFKYTQDELIKKNKKELEDIFEELKKLEYEYLLK